jgi:outer membrane protein TolC
VIARSDTLEWALVQAYQNNPSLNAQRAALRAADENVPQALSGYRPKLAVTASGGCSGNGRGCRPKLAYPAHAIPLTQQRFELAEISL